MKLYRMYHSFQPNVILQEIQERAREEAINVLGDEPYDITPTIEQIQQLVYVNMIIQEARIKDSLLKYIQQIDIYCLNFKLIVVLQLIVCYI